MKKLNIILFCLFLSGVSFAQGHGYGQGHGQGQGRIEKQLSHEEMRAEKVAYLTNQIDLSLEEAQKFWPVYNAYQKELEAFMTEVHEIMYYLRENKETITDTDLETKIDRLMQIEVEKAAVISKYHEMFKDVLPIQKVSRLYMAEHGFRRHLLEKYRQKGRGDDMPPPPDMHE